MASTTPESGPPGRTPLAGFAARIVENPNGDRPGLVIRQLPHHGKINVRGGDEVLPAIAATSGFARLPEANRFESVGDRFLVWQGPDEYLLLCPAGQEISTQNQLGVDLAGIHSAVTNVTDSLCVLQLRGPAVRQVIAKGCTIDMHPARFMPGHSAQTTLAKASVTILCVQTDSFVIVARSSFTPYVLDWLLDAAVEFGAHYRV